VINQGLEGMQEKNGALRVADVEYVKHLTMEQVSDGVKRVYKTVQKFNIWIIYCIPSNW
jgi:hypothetical protein